MHQINMAPLRRHSNWKSGAMIALVALLTAWSTLTNPGYFSHDELSFVHQPLFQNGHLISLNQQQFFRPLGIMLIWALTNLLPSVQLAHLGSVALHVLNALLMQRNLMLAEHARPRAGALFFAVSPLAAYSVAWTAAVFDLGWVTFALLIWWMIQTNKSASNQAVVGMWTGVLYICALLFKETALAIPLLMVAGLIAKRKRPTPPEFTAMLVMASCSMVYLIFQFTRLDELAHTGKGGYGLANAQMMAQNAVAYWVFPWAYQLTEVQQTWAMLSLTAIFLLALTHLALAHAMNRGSSIKTATYAIFYFLPLAPVLLISKHETQYLYGTAITSAICLSHWSSYSTWRRNLFSAIVAFSMLHAAQIHRSFKKDGQCQNNFLASLAQINWTDSKINETVRFQAVPGTRWWVISRALVHLSFLRDRNIEGSLVTSDAAADVQVDTTCKAAIQQLSQPSMP